MKFWLQRKEIRVNLKRVRRLLRLMGLEAIYPKPRLSKGNPEHSIYTYLLRNLDIKRPNQVWCSDITYVRMGKGFLYLTVIMDWFSRKVLSWELSNTLDTSFCASALKEALQRYGKPEIFNTDQGSQYTSKDFTDILKDNGIDISMDGRGRALDNVFVERLWRTVKDEPWRVLRPLQRRKAAPGSGLHEAFGSILRSRCRETGQLLRKRKQKNQCILKREKGQQTTGPITLFLPPSGPVSREYLTLQARQVALK